MIESRNQFSILFAIIFKSRSIESSSLEIIHRFRLSRRLDALRVEFEAEAIIPGTAVLTKTLSVSVACRRWITFCADKTFADSRMIRRRVAVIYAIPCTKQASSNEAVFSCALVCSYPVSDEPEGNLRLGI